ncbi:MULTISPECIES: hypothetical protein [Luteococcus]|uniref:hypothetical protein n=1 Tax=Luteococcus TaxID=33983 RepID=UPI00117D8117|nr:MULTISPECIES: hypothetical protein [Luteococcus]MDN5563286.1 hypothetical protein [Luteococcus sp.]
MRCRPKLTDIQPVARLIRAVRQPCTRLNRTAKPVADSCVGTTLATIGSTHPENPIEKTRPSMKATT